MSECYIDFFLLGNKSTAPDWILHPQTESQKGVSVMNSMLPQRSAATTLGYGSGETTFNIIQQQVTQ